MENNKEKKADYKRLVSWGGLKGELFWIAFIVLMLFAAYSYKRDIDLCRPYILDPCSKCIERDVASLEILKAENKYLREEQVGHFNLNELNLSLENNNG